MNDDTKAVWTKTLLNEDSKLKNVADQIQEALKKLRELQKDLIRNAEQLEDEPDTSGN